MLDCLSSEIDGQFHMRRLLLLRHAKAASSPGQPDRNRALSVRGRAAAPLVGAFLKREELTPDLALVSTATRTRETWMLVAPHLPRLPKVIFDDRLYLAETDAILDALRDVPASVLTVLVVGHNPGLHELAVELSANGDERWELEQKFPTAALAVIGFDCENWDRVAEVRGTLERFVSPANLGAGAN